MLPNDDDPPAELLQFSLDASIAFDISIDLRLPECGVLLGHCRVANRAMMPKTAVDEDRHPLSRVSDIGMPGCFLPVQPISRIAEFSKHLANSKFRFGIPTLVGFHGFGDTGVYGNHMFCRDLEIHDASVSEGCGRDVLTSGTYVYQPF